MRRAWHAWQRLDDKRYKTRSSESCFCAPRKVVVTLVRGGKVVSVTRGRTRADIPRSGWTMDRYFFCSATTTRRPTT